FTRARDQLSITASGATASRFLLEAGLEPRRPYAAPREIRAVASPARVNALPPPASDDLARVLEQARLLGAEDLSAGMTVGQLFATLGTPGEETKLRPTAILERLDTGAQRRLLRHLRALTDN
ncbi:MAG TPA: hypothetical protein VI300_26250, partial [Solirubrobacter sp.]